MIGSKMKMQIRDIQPVLKIDYYCDECEEFVISTNVNGSGIVTVGCSNAFSCRRVAKKVEAAIDSGKRPQDQKEVHRG